ncbi:hypothetical protein ACFS5M_12625 [Lacinutrix iliipiscaria]|uniref:Uncharacterized protein n=1 Tax=Lacinutrix iliipiscaria TaxID=1230532 RepID=A0ABW5WRC8_9FLAO
MKNIVQYPNTESEFKTDSLNDYNELDIISQKHPFLKNYVNNLKNDTLVYSKCKACNLPGLNNKNIIGYTDRVRPTGNYFRKDIKIGDFEFDTFFVYEKKIYENDNEYKKVYKWIYFCYFNEKQKKEFNQFSHYYDNMISHGKQLLDIDYINNIAVIKIQFAGY